MAQYEMGLRDYWRILRKRKLAVLLTCIAAGGLTYYLTQHVFHAPPEFLAQCEISVHAAEVPGQPGVISVNVAQEANLIKSEMLLREVLWAVEHYPFYDEAPGSVFPAAPPARPEEQERIDRHRRILAALQKLDPGKKQRKEAPNLRRVASLREFVYLFGNQTSLCCRKINDLARAIDDALLKVAAKEAADKEADLREFAPDQFLSHPANKEPRGLLIAQLQERMGDATWDRDTVSFRFAVQTTAPGITDRDAALGAAAATRIAETIAAVYEAYREFQGQRKIARRIKSIQGEIQRLIEERTRFQEIRRKARADIDRLASDEEYREAQRAYLREKDKLQRLQAYLRQLQKHIEKRKASRPGDSVLATVPPPPAGIGDVNIQDRYKTSAELEKKKNDQLEFYKPDSHVIQALEQKIIRTAEQLRAAVVSAVGNRDEGTGLQAAVRAAEERLAVLAARVPKKQLQVLADATQKISEKTDAINRQQAELNKLLLFKEQGVEVDITERPTAAERIGRASVLTKTVIGAFIGLMLGVVIAVLWETLDLTIGTIEEVEAFLDTRVLGVVPHVEADRLAAEIRAGDPEGEADTPDAELHQRAMLVTLYDPKSVAAEAFRHIRTRLDFARMQQKPGARVFLITSATLYEGKTVTAANLAVVMAQNGKRTCLVECDLRRPQLHRLFGVDKGPGLYDICIGKMGWREARKSLSDLLLGKIGMETAIGTPGLENLSILTCGAIPPNPVELLDSDETRRLFADLREAFDVIIVDCPPILPVADAAVVSPFADGAILVYRAGAAPRTVLSRAKTQLESVGMHLFGVVLNDLRPAAGEVSATYPYKGYARKAYATPEEQIAPRVSVPPTPAEPVGDRVGEDAEEQLLRKTDLALSQGRIEQAIELAHEAIRTLPESISLRLQLAKAFAAAGRVNEAQAELIHVLDLDPRNLPALQKLAEMAADAGLEREALRWYEEILEFAPDHAEAKARSEEIRARIGDSDAQTV